RKLPIITETLMLNICNSSLLEVESQSQLHAPLRPRRGHLAERGGSLGSGRCEAGGAVHGHCLRVIRHVVDLPAQLKHARLLQGEVLEERRIPVVETRATEFGAIKY